MEAVARTLRRLNATQTLLALALALGAVLRFAALDARGWWRDEAVTVELLRLPFTELLRTIPESEGSPPLYYMIAWAWTRLLGDGEVALRSLSALLGTATVLVVYLAGRELVSGRTGLAAAFLAATSPMLVWHAQDARSYALFVLLAALSFLFFVRLLRAPSVLDAVGFGLASALGLLTHYFAAFAIVPEAVWLLASSKTRRLAALPVTAVAALGLAVLPLAQAQRGNVSWVAEVPRLRRIVEVAQEFLVGPQAPWEVPVTVLAGLLFLAALALLVTRGTPIEWRAALPALATGTVALVLPLMLALFGLDYVLGRNLIAAWVPLAIVVAAGLSAERVGITGLATGTAIVALGIAVVAGSASTPKHFYEDWRGAARSLGPPPPGGRAIVLWPGFGLDPFLLYRPRATPLPAGGAAVSEVVVLAFGGRRRDVDELGSSLYPARPPFRETGRRDEPYFTIVRFEASRPIAVTVETLVATGPDAPTTNVLLDRG